MEATGGAIGVRFEEVPVAGHPRQPGAAGQGHAPHCFRPGTEPGFSFQVCAIPGSFRTHGVHPQGPKAVTLLMEPARPEAALGLVPCTLPARRRALASERPLSSLQSLEPLRRHPLPLVSHKEPAFPCARGAVSAGLRLRLRWSHPPHELASASSRGCLGEGRPPFCAPGLLHSRCRQRKHRREAGSELGPQCSRPGV